VGKNKKQMGYFEEIQEAKSFIQDKFNATPQIGVVLGSGLGAFAESFADATTISYGDIPHFAQSGVAGHAGELVLGELDGVTCAVMSGRVHFYEGFDMQKVTFPMRVLKALGCESILITNAAGSMNENFTPGDIMMITDHINMTGDNPLSGPNDERLGPRFPDMSTAYGPKGQTALKTAAAEMALNLRQGIYVGLSGPSYETPAEIRMFRTVGADAVGMSTVAEVIVAQHSGMNVAGLSILTNNAAGFNAEPLSHDEVKETADRVKGTLIELLNKSVKHLACP
jgi:purine-nucleoside phosphorylase